MTTNLGTGVTSGEYAFKHPDTKYNAVYAKCRIEYYTGAVVVDTEDRDVYVQAAYVSQQLRGNLQVPCHALRRGCRYHHTVPCHHWQ